MALSDAVVGVGPAWLSEKAAIDAEGLPADERGIFAEQELHGGGDIIGSANAAKGSEASPRRGEIGELSFGAFGIDGARCDAVDADAERAELQCRRFCKHFNAAFAGGVSGKIREGNFV